MWHEWAFYCWRSTRECVLPIIAAQFMGFTTAADQRVLLRKGFWDFLRIIRKLFPWKKRIEMRYSILLTVDDIWKKVKLPCIYWRYVSWHNQHFSMNLAVIFLWIWHLNTLNWMYDLTKMLALSVIHVCSFIFTSWINFSSDKQTKCVQLCTYVIHCDSYWMQVHK